MLHTKHRAIKLVIQYSLSLVSSGAVLYHHVYIWLCGSYDVTSDLLSDVTSRDFIANTICQN